MIEALEFIFKNGWTYFGTIILIVVIGGMVAACINQIGARGK